MENFTMYNPVQLHFGKDCLTEFGAIARTYGTKALVMYGGSSSTRYGYVPTVKRHLENVGVTIAEYGKVSPNPTVEQVREAIAIAQKEKIDFIVAVGGGSVIDAAKIVSVSSPENLDPWMVMTRKANPTKYIPLLTVLTIAATGSEMNNAAVVQNNEVGKKIGLVHPLIYPQHSFLNPEFTLTVPPDQTAYGIVDMIAHALEAWFGTPAPNLTNLFTLNIIDEAMKNGIAVMKNPKNYQARFNLMLTATCALNGITEICRENGDWGVHSIGHELSLQFDIPHGASLSIVYPAWMTYFADHRVNEMVTLGKYLFNVSTPKETISKLKDFFEIIGAPTQLPWKNIGTEHKEQILAGLNRNRAGGYVHRLSDEDRKAIVELMFNPAIS